MFLPPQTFVASLRLATRDVRVVCRVLVADARVTAHEWDTLNQKKYLRPCPMPCGDPDSSKTNHLNLNKYKIYQTQAPIFKLQWGPYEKIKSTYSTVLVQSEFLFEFMTKLQPSSCFLLIRRLQLRHSCL